MMNISEIDSLLRDYNRMPIASRQPTYLELCRYPRRRFEEICSRLLCFYFAPYEEHGLKDLFLSSFLEIISPDKKLPIFLSNVQIVDEENSNGKRLDILIRSDDFIIGIENKVGADLYNPLNDYKERIDLYNKPQDVNFKVVLSLRKIIKQNEVQLMNDNGFRNVTYNQFFSVVRKNIGNYITESSTKYFLYANDFIQTIENMENLTALNPHLDNYFFDNSDKINILIKTFNKYNERIFAIQSQKISDLHELLKQRTERGKWYIWEGEYLGCHELNLSRPNIGLESSFTTTKENPFGLFNVYIVTWELKAWKEYSQSISARFGTFDEHTNGNKTEKLVRTIKDGTEEELVNGLMGIYDFIDKLTNKIS